MNINTVKWILGILAAILICYWLTAGSDNITQTPSNPDDITREYKQ